LARNDAAYRFAELLARNGRTEDLRRRADNGDPYAATHLDDLLASTGDLDTFRQRAAHDDRGALSTLVYSLIEQGQAEQATALLRRSVWAGPFCLSSTPAAVTASELAVGICVDRAARRARPLIGLQIDDHIRT
jgi:hypothetical protein